MDPLGNMNLQIRQRPTRLLPLVSCKVFGLGPGLRALQSIHCLRCSRDKCKGFFGFHRGV